ncbi:TPA: terminase, partial [Salmonella enterica]|nr:terminase [Salmonella enterica]
MSSEFEAMLADDMGRFFYDPLGFVMYAFEWGAGELDGFDGPDEWQKEFLTDWGEAIRTNNFDGVKPVEAYRCATSSGHGIGKSALTAWVILYIMSTRPFCKGVVTANTSEQLRTKTWGELGKWKKRCITGHWFEYNNGKGNMNIYHVDHMESWRCDGQTCREENSESFAGLHAANSSPFYIFDEASAVPDKIWEVAEGGLTDGEPFWFAFGNPTRNTGRFRECFRKFKHRWRRKQIDSRLAKMTNKELIEEWRNDYGED